MQGYYGVIDISNIIGRATQAIFNPTFANLSLRPAIPRAIAEQRNPIDMFLQD